MSTRDQPTCLADAVDTYESGGISGISEQEFRRSLSSEPSPKHQGFRADVGLQNIARRTLGIILLLITVILWTTSNFLASVSGPYVRLLCLHQLTKSSQYIFADDSYSKPYFVTYFNTAFFAISLVPILLRIAHQHGFHKITLSTVLDWQHRQNAYESNRRSLEEESGHMGRGAPSDVPLLQDDSSAANNYESSVLVIEEMGQARGVLSIRETAVLSLEFCLLWFLANYFVAACLEYTSVASSTILTSTSSIWTLIFGAMLRVENFTLKKLVGVLSSLAGIILISMVDLSGDNDDHRGSFPHKSQRQIAIGMDFPFSPFSMSSSSPVC